MRTLLLGTLLLTFPPTAKVAGEIFLAPDGNYVGLLELGEGRVLKLMDGWKGMGVWCGEMMSVNDYVQVCGTGEILMHSAGMKVQMRGPGVVVDDVATRGDL